jgi:redox-regulated HSP33 family molecular chaperone
MKHEVIYEVECGCGLSRITWGIKDSDIIIKQDINDIICHFCSEKYNLIKYKVKVL